MSTETPKDCECDTYSTVVYRYVDSLTAHWYYTNTTALVEWTFEDYDWDDCRKVAPCGWVLHPERVTERIFRITEDTIVY